MSLKGKPVRVSPESIRRAIGVKRWFFNKRLVKTRQFLLEVNESTKNYRIRKINWAIEDRIQNEKSLIQYIKYRYMLVLAMEMMKLRS